MPTLGFHNAVLLYALPPPPLPTQHLAAYMYFLAPAALPGGWRAEARLLLTLGYDNAVLFALMGAALLQSAALAPLMVPALRSDNQVCVLSLTICVSAYVHFYMERLLLAHAAMCVFTCRDYMEHQTPHTSPTHPQVPLWPFLAADPHLGSLSYLTYCSLCTLRCSHTHFLSLHISRPHSHPRCPCGPSSPRALSWGPCPTSHTSASTRRPAARRGCRRDPMSSR